MTLRRLIFGCWTKHSEPVWEADHLRCLTCNTLIDVLPQDVIRGPAHDPEPVRGIPQQKAKIVRPGNVREWRQSQR